MEGPVFVTLTEPESQPGIRRFSSVTTQGIGRLAERIAQDELGLAPSGVRRS